MSDITYSDAIEQVMIHNGYYAPLKLIYKEIWKYKDKSKIVGITPENTIQERVQRDQRFTRIANGVYALTSFMENIEESDSGYFIYKNDEILFHETRKFFQTEKIVEQKIRIGQSFFRNKLIDELQCCPITGINSTKLLVASHIKPWSHSNNEERVNIKNGLLLSPLYDKLFDKGIGWITFTVDKRILLSNKIGIENISRLGVVNNQIIHELVVDGREEFLEYHQKHIYQG